ncbi:MAG: hypothetical protein CM15mP103_03180 [Gammaproteobacteria bacterium]|nr:MAG: hypothetical protein CM15mP103_03180 [Gammaproteobacteria bacterium]
MAAIFPVGVAWEKGCNYCHVRARVFQQTAYTKKVSRVMILMTQNANENWGPSRWCRVVSTRVTAVITSRVRMEFLAGSPPSRVGDGSQMQKRGRTKLPTPTPHSPSIPFSPTC